MDEDVKLVDNVYAFIDRASALYGKMRAERFAQDMQAECLECGMESPIEHLFWVACKALCEAQYIDCNPDPDFQPGREEPEWHSGLYVTAQTKVGPYRVDFVMRYVPICNAPETAPVAIELDGHAFHDKDKRQRAYEKGRDRYLVKHGYRVLHFTGSEVFADPFKTAHEAMSLFGIFDDEYQATDPLGLGD